MKSLSSPLIRDGPYLLTRVGARVISPLLLAVHRGGGDDLRLEHVSPENTRGEVADEAAAPPFGRLVVRSGLFPHFRGSQGA